MRSVLIVDGDASFRRAAARLIDDTDLDVAGEANGVESAMVAVQKLLPEVALVGVHLPDGDGFELALRFTALPWRPLVVLTSSDPNAATTLSAHRAGAVGFLAKDELSDGALVTMIDQARPPPVPD